jgi:hypothetical protein|tara:strand:+ start:4413 stop:4544 length:132 start_codon:yes stop_codon:yes gene_type:complete
MTDYLDYIKLIDNIFKPSDSMFTDAYDFFLHADNYYEEIEEDV